LRLGSELGHRWSLGSIQVALPRFPIPKLLISFVLADAVGLLNLSYKLIALPSNLVEVVIGNFSPLLLYLAFDLLPVSCNSIPVHLRPSIEKRTARLIAAHEQALRKPHADSPRSAKYSLVAR
jgi:hypothetical protein